MENYEKKYKQALERARYYHNRDNIQFLEQIFPELKESEDERIRKEIISFLEGFYANKNKDRWIAWLEKQGASIDVDYFLNKVGIKSAYKDGNAWCILFGDNIQDGICGFGYTKEEALIEFLKDLLEKQGEHISSL